MSRKVEQSISPALYANIEDAKREQVIKGLFMNKLRIECAFAHQFKFPFFFKLFFDKHAYKKVSEREKLAQGNFSLRKLGQLTQIPDLEIYDMEIGKKILDKPIKYELLLNLYAKHLILYNIYNEAQVELWVGDTVPSEYLLDVRVNKFTSKLIPIISPDNYATIQDRISTSGIVMKRYML